MPVSRNLSLPASIEGRKKIRPDSLFRSNTEVHSSSGSSIHRSKPVDLSSLLKLHRPNFLPTTLVPVKHNNNNYEIVTEDESVTPTNESNNIAAEIETSNETVMGVDTTTTRGGTLSQPCLSALSNVGATQIFPHLFLGSQKDVVDEKMMRSNSITYVLNVSKTCTKPEFIDDSHFHRISVRDNYQEKMTPYIKEAIEFIEKVRKSNQRVIVHCLAGVSRSATVAIAYVLHYLRINFEDAYRFVKEKRPSISPNFNFLGQLMEFERNLESTGYLSSKRTGSLSEGSEEDSQQTFSCQQNKIGDHPGKTSLRLSFLKTGSDCSPLSMPPACSFQCSTQDSEPLQLSSESCIKISTPTSSFCRRRKGPTFSKMSFSLANNANNNSSNRKCDTPMPKFMNSKNMFGSKSGRLLVDIRVDSPSTTTRVPDSSRRLGSDGFEKDENMACDSETPTYTSGPFISPCSQGVSFSTSHQAMECNTSDSSISNQKNDGEFLRPYANPVTLLVGSKNESKTPTWHPGNLSAPKVTRHRRSASGGGITSEILQSPFNMKRRFEQARTERSASIGDVSLGDQLASVEHCTSVKRGGSFSGMGSYYDYSEPSSRSPHKFVSVNSRSPKILRKSFHLNLKPVYSHTTSPPTSKNGSNKSEGATAPISIPGVLGMDTPVPVFDCSHMSDSCGGLKMNSNKSSAFPGHSVIREGVTPDESDDTLEIKSMSPLTLSSPNVDKDGCPSFPTSSSLKTRTSPATCPILSTVPSFSCNEAGMTSPRFIYKSSFTYTSTKSKPLTDTKTNTPFTLSAPCDLKLKWRNKERRRQSVDSGYLSSQASSQSSSSFTSPTSQQSVFGSASIHESFNDNTDNTSTPTTSPTNVGSCHVEGAFDASDEVSTTPPDSENRKTNVRQRSTVEIMSCS
ncbi:uncharacterized protein LOC120330721 [Styela clava]